MRRTNLALPIRQLISLQSPNLPAPAPPASPCTCHQLLHSCAALRVALALQLREVGSFGDNKGQEDELDVQCDAESCPPCAGCKRGNYVPLPPSHPPPPLVSSSSSSQSRVHQRSPGSSVGVCRSSFSDFTLI